MGENIFMQTISNEAFILVIIMIRKFEVVKILPQVGDLELTPQEMDAMNQLNKNTRLIGNYCYPDG